MVLSPNSAFMMKTLLVGAFLVIVKNLFSTLPNIHPTRATRRNDGGGGESFLKLLLLFPVLRSSILEPNLEVVKIFMQC